MSVVLLQVRLRTEGPPVNNLTASTARRTCVARVVLRGDWISKNQLGVQQKLTYIEHEVHDLGRGEHRPFE
jgi:hypothetical protein